MLGPPEGAQEGWVAPGGRSIRKHQGAHLCVESMQHPSALETP